MTKPRELTDQELKEIIQKIAAPTFKYMMKRIDNHILTDKSQSDMSINSFITVLLISLASMDTSMIRWIEGFYLSKIGKPLDPDRLRTSLIHNLNEQLGIKVH